MIEELKHLFDRNCVWYKWQTYIRGSYWLYRWQYRSGSIIHYRGAVLQGIVDTFRERALVRRKGILSEALDDPFEEGAEEFF